MEKTEERGIPNEILGLMEQRVGVGCLCHAWKPRWVRVNWNIMPCLIISKERRCGVYRSILIPLHEISNISVQRIQKEWGEASVFKLQTKHKMNIQLRVRSREEESFWLPLFLKSVETPNSANSNSTKHNIYSTHFTPLTLADATTFRPNNNNIGNNIPSNSNIDNNIYNEIYNDIYNDIPSNLKDREQEVDNNARKLECGGQHGNTGKEQRSNGEVIKSTDDLRTSSSEQYLNRKSSRFSTVSSFLTATQTQTSTQDRYLSSRSPPFPNFRQRVVSETVPVKDNIDRNNNNVNLNNNNIDRNNNKIDKATNSESIVQIPEGINESAGFTQGTIQPASFRPVRGNEPVTEMAQLTVKQNPRRIFRLPAPIVPPKHWRQHLPVPKIQPPLSMASTCYTISDNRVGFGDDDQRKIVTQDPDSRNTAGEDEGTSKDVKRIDGGSELETSQVKMELPPPPPPPPTIGVPTKKTEMKPERGNRNPNPKRDPSQDMQVGQRQLDGGFEAELKRAIHARQQNKKHTL